ncbi:MULTISPECIES: hypothetical protein [Nostocales]|uniref:Uncharacterized protein n=3 Tax=Nostocales TaxID=1161 RepID=A0A8S9SWR2_9CYAN|nr:hypothetical protein [Tolypothrix bouteillei]KAF3884570.1 hypothetical protein DA73_0400003095 [Tolypothrix bouteillei VB521301]
MQKVTSLQAYSYSLITLMTFATLLGTSNHVLSQTAQRSLKSFQTAFTVDFVSPYSKTQPTSASQKKPPATSKVKNRYSITTILEGETANFIVKIYKENNQILYLGKSRKDPNKPVKLPAKVVGKSKYRANNGSYSYIVNPDGVEVWQSGRKIRADRFRLSKVFQ